MFRLQLVLQSWERECLWNMFLRLSRAPGSTSVAGFCLGGLRKGPGRQEENSFPSWAPESTVVPRTHREHRCSPVRCPSFMGDGGLLDPCCAVQGAFPCPFPGSRRDSVRARVGGGRLPKPHLLARCAQPGFHPYFLRLVRSAVAWAHSYWPSLRSALDPIWRSWDDIA